MAVHIVRTQFINMIDGSVGYGVRIYDEMGNQAYDNTSERHEIPDDDLDLLGECVDQNIGKEILESITDEETLYIDGTAFTYNEVEHIL